MIRFTTCVCSVLLLAGCGKRDNAQEPAAASDTADVSALPQSQPAPPDPLPPAASVQLQPTAGSRTYGSLQVAAVPGGVRLSGEVQGLQPDSEFGFHIHENGDCSAPDGSSAGAHFNPAAGPHGRPDAQLRHAGDMSNLKSDAAGVGKVDVAVQGVSLQQGDATDVLGKAVIVHAQPDDYSSQPAGNAGARIACGVIAVQVPTTEVTPPTVSGGGAS